MNSTVGISKSTVSFAGAAVAASEEGEMGDAMRTVVRRGAAEATVGMLTAEARARAAASIAAAMKEGTAGGASLDDDICCR